ncbi:short chain dehydrogenase [Moniliophthora roreri]|nr:short chain dehydrogenase [Moniliophthora roreri]
MDSSNWADGTAFVNQCPIAKGNNFLYDFTAIDQAGMFWYHSHLPTQYCDGLRGPIVIYDPDDPHASLYDVDDESTVITLADWYHTKAKEITFGTPDNYLISGSGSTSPPNPLTRKTLYDEGLSNVKFVQLDMTWKSSIQSAVDFIFKAEGKLDILVHNAALARMDALQNASSVDTDIIKETMEINFYGVIYITQAFLPLLREPVILLISMDMASNTQQSPPDSYLHVVAYNTSKAAANSYLIALAKELKNNGFRVNAVTPGLTTTKLDGFVHGRETTEKAAELLSESVLLQEENGAILER